MDHQSDFCANLLVIAVEGIPIEHMYSGFKQIIMSQFNLKAIYEHKNTQKEDTPGKCIGRWNFMCHQLHFNRTAKSIKDTIATLYENYLTDTNQQTN